MTVMTIDYAKSKYYIILEIVLNGVHKYSPRINSFRGKHH